MVESRTEFEPLIRPLFQLANGPLEASVFRSACESFLRFDHTSSDADLWYFWAGPTARLALIVGVEIEPAVGRRDALGQARPSG
jgi:hypothetical protein